VESLCDELRQRAAAGTDIDLWVRQIE